MYHIDNFCHLYYLEINTTSRDYICILLKSEYLTWKNCDRDLSI